MQIAEERAVKAESEKRKHHLRTVANASLLHSFRGKLTDNEAEVQLEVEKRTLETYCLTVRSSREAYWILGVFF